MLSLALAHLRSRTFSYVRGGCPCRYAAATAGGHDAGQEQPRQSHHAMSFPNLHCLNEQLLQGFHSPHGPLHFSLPTLLCANASLFHCFSPADTSLFRCPSSADASLFCCFSLVLGRGLPISLMLPLPAVMLNLLLLALFLLLGLRSCALLLSLSLKCNLLCHHFFHFND